MKIEVSVGSIRCRIVSDGNDLYPPALVFANVSEADRAAALDGWLNEDGFLPSSYSAVLVSSAGRLCLLDAGLGELAALEGSPAGLLLTSMRELDVSPDDVEAVVISHGHPDHIGGLVASASDGQVAPVFSRATHYVVDTEWTTWTTPDGLSTVPPDFVEPARRCLTALADAGLVEVVDDDVEVLPGVRLLAAPGHTPGHAVVEVRSANESALYLADAVVHELDFDHPEWLCAFDMDAVGTIETRRRLLDRATRNETAVSAFHLSGWGRVRRVGDGYQFVGG